MEEIEKVDMTNYFMFSIIILSIYIFFTASHRSNQQKGGGFEIIGKNILFQLFIVGLFGLFIFLITHGGQLFLLIGVAGIALTYFISQAVKVY